MTNKIVNFLLAIMFLGFAFLQLNDDNDVVLWIAIYGVMSVVCVLAMFHYYPKIVLWTLTGLYALYSIYYIPGVKEWLHQDDKAQLFDNIAKMEHPFIEESREFLGLWICIIVLVVYIVKSRRK